MWMRIWMRRVCSTCIPCIFFCIVASHKASAEGALRALPVEAQRQARSQNRSNLYES